MIKKIIDKTGFPAFFVIVFFAGGIFVYLVDESINHHDIPCIRDYKFLGKHVDCEESSRDELDRMNGVESMAEKIISGYVAEGKVDKASIFVRDLENRYWFAIKPDEKYIPASLLKTFIMVSYLKLALVEPGILDREIVYDGSYAELNSIDDNIPVEERLTKGQSYKIKDLINLMIKESSNTATQLLVSSVDRNFLLNIYEDFGIVIPKGTQNEILNKEIVSPRVYANLYRSLYNGNYLTSVYSNMALKYLSEVEFKDGLVAGVPDGTLISHKFGDRKIINPDGSQDYTLSDCGIVYAPRHDYSICIMSKGSDLKVLESLIKDLSTLTYNEIGK